MDRRLETLGHARLIIQKAEPYAGDRGANAEDPRIGVDAFTLGP